MKVVIAMVMTMSLYADCSWVMTVNPTTGEIVEVYVCD